MSGDRPRSMAVRHYQALYGTPPPLTRREIAGAAAAVLAVAAPVAWVVFRALVRS